MNRNNKAAKNVDRTGNWPSEIVLPEGVESGEHMEQREDSELDVTWFSRKETQEKRPAMVFVHGGSWKKGDKKQYYRQAVHLAEKHNVFGVCVEYRLSGVAKYPAALEDCKCALRWTRSVAERRIVDTGRIGICGGSAGAHLAALVATTNGIKSLEGCGPYGEFSSDVHLAVLYNGHFDMNDQLKDHVQDEDMFTFFGGNPWEIPEVYGAASPFLRVSSESPPMLFLHGDRDRYPHRQSIAMAERLRHFGVHAEVEIFEGKGHAWFNHGEDNRITTERMCRFIENMFGLKGED
jgi:acetyl esterase/lipase